MAISNAARLKIYNAACRFMGQTKLATITEAREPRYTFDDIWDNGFLNECLEQGQWNFSGRTASLTYSPSITPSFGHRYAFDIPTDLVRLKAMCQDEFLNVPLLRYRHDAQYWFADIDTIYINYVSDDDLFGNDRALWSESFRNYVEAHLAEKASISLTVSEERLKRITVTKEKALAVASSIDAQGDPTKFFPRGAWALARGGNARRYDRGTR